MADPQKPAAGTAAPNPSISNQGLPRLRAKLPSRNWSIFLTIVGSFTTAVIYDRRHKKRELQKWCDAVSHLSRDPLDPSQLPRKLTVFLAAPPGDGLRPSREYFQEYVKPILVSAAVDWDVIEGRKEGELRARLAAQIRRTRRRQGERAEGLEEEEDIVQDLRDRNSISTLDTRAGNLVIGRHAWKEYMRGLHEGWLGPLVTSSESKEQAETPLESTIPALAPSDSIDPVTSLDVITEGEKNEKNESVVEEASPTAASEKTDTEKAKSKAKETSKNTPPPPFIATDAYTTAALSASAPDAFAPTILLPQPHLLGFLNTPTRIYRFLTRRRLAETATAEVGRLLLADDSRSFTSSSTDGDSTEPSFPGDVSIKDQSNLNVEGPVGTWEQQGVLASEELDWHKSSRAQRAEGVEAVWQDDIVVDPRIGERMRTPLAIQPSTEIHNDLSPPAQEDGSIIKGNSFDWKGGADRGRLVSWGTWIKEAAGWEEPREIRGLGAKDGLTGDEAD